MNFRVVRINDLKLSKTHFYSVKLGGKAYSEFRDFVERMKPDNKNLRECLEIVKWFKDWADFEGALEEFFKEEREADRLYQPMELTIKESSGADQDFGLRLYCYRYDERIVILFNGDRKTYRNSEDCPKVRGYFKQAVAMAKALNAAFSNKDLFVEDVFEIRSRPGIELKIDEHYG